jgi:hypothetical protein
MGLHLSSVGRLPRPVGRKNLSLAAVAQPGLRDEASAEKGIEAIKTHAPNAKVEDHSET